MNFLIFHEDWYFMKIDMNFMPLHEISWRSMKIISGMKYIYIYIYIDHDGYHSNSVRCPEQREVELWAPWISYRLSWNSRRMFSWKSYRDPWKSYRSRFFLIIFRSVNIISIEVCLVWSVSGCTIFEKIWAPIVYREAKKGWWCCCSMVHLWPWPLIFPGVWSPDARKVVYSHRPPTIDLRKEEDKRMRTRKSS